MYSNINIVYTFFSIVYSIYIFSWTDFRLSFFCSFLHFHGVNESVLNTNLKMNRLVKCYVWSVLLSGCKVWTVEKRDRNSI